MSLSRRLVDAGISHPHPYVAEEAALGQRLDVKQMAWLFAKPLFEENPYEVIQAQKQMGATDTDIQAAQKMAEEFIQRMKNREPLENPSFRFPSEQETK